MELKILQESSDCPGANKVCHWVRSCFEALDKKYLNSLVIGLYMDPSDPNTLLESYRYGGGDTQTSLRTILKQLEICQHSPIHMLAGDH